jgi:hypothetical protein
MCRTDDPITDFHNHDAKMERHIARLPECTYCHDPIQDDYLYDTGHGILCEDCMKDLCRKPVEDYIR